MEKVEIRKSNSFTWNVNNWISFSEFLQVFTLKKTDFKKQAKWEQFQWKMGSFLFYWCYCLVSDSSVWAWKTEGDYYYAKHSGTNGITYLLGKGMSWRKRRTRHSVFGVLSENHRCACQWYPAAGRMLLLYQEGRNWGFRWFIFIVDSSVQARG